MSLQTLIEDNKHIQQQAIKNINDWEPDEAFMAMITKTIMSGSPVGPETLSKHIFPFLYPDDLLKQTQDLGEKAATLSLDDFREFMIATMNDTSLTKIESAIVEKLREKFMGNLGL